MDRERGINHPRFVERKLEITRVCAINDRCMSTSSKNVGSPTGNSRQERLDRFTRALAVVHAHVLDVLMRADGGSGTWFPHTRREKGVGWWHPKRKVDGIRGGHQPDSIGILLNG